MKKIGILTFHRTTNYGALLQCYALYKTLYEMNYDVEVIDYRCKYLEERELPHLSLKFNGIKKMASDLYRYHSRKKKLKAMDDFYTKIKFSKIIYDENNKSEIGKYYDIVIVGSDIVWELGVTGFDFTYFLDFLDPKKRNSYSASFGNDNIYLEYKEKYKEELKKFNAISVREESGSKIINDLINKNVEVTLDPTLLLEKKDWEKFTTKEFKVKPYILLYFLDDNNEIINKAYRYAELYDFDIYLITNSFRKISGIKNIKYSSVGDFLNLFYNAEMIMTASYHGMIFSIIFEKEFRYYNRSHSSRMESLSKKLNIEKCELIRDELKMIKLDYKKINDEIDKLRYKSLSYLKNEILL